MTKKKMQHNKLRRSADPDFVSTAGNVDLLSAPGTGNVDLLPAPGTGNMMKAGLLTVIQPLPERRLQPEVGASASPESR